MFGRCLRRPCSTRVLRPPVTRCKSSASCARRPRNRRTEAASSTAWCSPSATEGAEPPTAGCHRGVSANVSTDVATTGGVRLRYAPVVVWLHVVFVIAWAVYANPFVNDGLSQAKIEHDVEPWTGQAIPGPSRDEAAVATPTFRGEVHCPRVADHRPEKRRERRGKSGNASLRRWGACWTPASNRGCRYWALRGGGVTGPPRDRADASRHGWRGPRRKVPRPCKPRRL